MKLNPTELKVLASLRRQHEGWKSTRVILLILHFAVLAFGVWLVAARNETAGVAIVAIGAYGLSYALSGWHGRPEIALLFRLVEHATSSDDA